MLAKYYFKLILILKIDYKSVRASKLLSPDEYNYIIPVEYTVLYSNMNSISKSNRHPHFLLFVVLTYFNTLTSASSNPYTVYRGYRIAPLTNISITSSTAADPVDCIDQCDAQLSPACYAAAFDPSDGSCTLSACARVVLTEADSSDPTPEELPRVYIKGLCLFHMKLSAVPVMIGFLNLSLILIFL